MTKFVYADNAATTKIHDEVIQAMVPVLSETYGNPSSIYSIGRTAKSLLDDARKVVASAINAKPEEIIFNSGGTEGDNTVLRGVARARMNKGKHIISSKIEHHAILHTLDALKKEGFEITLLDEHTEGFVSPADLEAAIRPDTILVSIMMANNEIGSIQPIRELGAICRAHKIPFHTDAVQAVGHIAIDVVDMNIDMLSLSAHKFGGPKGVGALYVRRGVAVQPYLTGGGQERSRRSGTENTAGIVGMAKALEISVAELESEKERISKLRDRLIDGVLQIPYSRLTGSRDNRLPGNASFCIEAIEGESLVLMLDMFGIAGSSGSACSSGSLDPSHVLMAIGLPHEIAHGSLRLSLGRENTEADVDYILETLPQVVNRLREMSPVWEEMNKK